MHSGYLWCILTFHLANLEHIPGMGDGAMDRNRHGPSWNWQRDLLYKNKAKKWRIAYKGSSGGWRHGKWLRESSEKRGWWATIQGVRGAEREGKGPIVNALSYTVQLGPDPQLAQEHKLNSRSRFEVKVGSPLWTTHQVVLGYEMFWRVGGGSLPGRWLPRSGSCEHQWSRAAGRGTDGVSYTCPRTREAVWQEGVGRATQPAWQSAEVNLTSVWRLGTWTGWRWTAGV